MNVMYLGSGSFATGGLLADFDKVWRTICIHHSNTALHNETVHLYTFNKEGLVCNFIQKLNSFHGGVTDWE